MSDLIFLLPCPFCAGKADFNNDGGRWHQVICNSCGCRSCEFPDNREKAALSWNTRAPAQPAHGALRQALHEASIYGIGATSDVNQRVILEAARASSSGQSIDCKTQSIDVAQTASACPWCGFSDGHHPWCRSPSQPARHAQQPIGLTVAGIDDAFDTWRKTLKVVDNPSNQDIFGQAYVAGWNAKELQYEAGMYKSLYEAARAITDALDSLLKEPVK